MNDFGRDFGDKNSYFLTLKNELRATFFDVPKLLQGLEWHSVYLSKFTEKQIPLRSIEFHFLENVLRIIGVTNRDVSRSKII